MPKPAKSKQKGFTLVELLVTIAIIGLLSTIVLVTFGGQTDKARIAKTLLWSRSIESRLGAYAVGIWNFDEGTGTTAADLSGYGNDGTLVNGPTWRCAEDDPSYTPSGHGCALEFDGENDYVNCGNNASLDFGTGDFAISSWIKTGIAGDYRPLIFKGFAGGDGGGYGFWRFGLRYGTTPWMLVGDATSYKEGGLGSVSIADNQWHNLSIVYDRDASAIGYVDGTQTGTLNISAIQDSVDNISPVMIGKSFDPFNGLIDEVRIYETALTSAQAEALYYVGLDNLYNKGKITEQEYQERLLANQ